MRSIMPQVHQRRGCARWLALPALFMAIAQAGAAFTAVRTPITETVRMVRALNALAALAWSIVFGLVALQFALNRRNALRYGAKVLLGYVLISTGWLVAFSQADYDRDRIVFRVGAALVIAVGLVLFLALWGRALNDGE